MRPSKPLAPSNWILNRFFMRPCKKSDPKDSYHCVNMDQKHHRFELISKSIQGKFCREAFLAFALYLFHWICYGCLFVALCGQMPEKAQALELTDNLQIHGFLTQGYFFTSANNIFGTSSIGGSFDYTEAGLTGSWAPTADFRLAAQVLFRRAGAGHEDDVELDFGLLDYTILSTVDYRLGVRLGRFKIPFGLYNETRDVLFTRPTILLPQSIYPDVTRDGSISADGGIIYGDYRDEWGNLSLELGFGYPRSANVDTELAIFGFDFPGNTFSGFSGIGRLSYDLDGGKYRMAITSVYADTRYDPEFLPPDDLNAGKVIFKPVIFSAQYNQEQVSLTGEYAIRPFRFTQFGEPIDAEVTGESYYLQAEYRFDKNKEAIVRYDVMYNNRNDKSGKKYQTETGYPAYFQYAKTWTVGLRYYVNPSLLISAEYNLVNGTAWLPIQDNPDIENWKQRWNIFSIAAGLQF